MKVRLVLAAVLIGAVFDVSGQRLHRAVSVQTQRNRPPAIHSFTSSQSNIDLCPFVQGITCGSVVKLGVSADDPDKDKLVYRYWVSAGQIVGSGAEVNWDLSRSTRGSETAIVEVTDGKNGRASSLLRVNIRPCPNCDPACPVLNVSCEDRVSEGKLTLFTATISDPEVNLRYTWRVINGTAAQGQRSARFFVKASGAPGDKITATVSVAGLDPACTREASCSCTIQKQQH